MNRPVQETALKIVLRWVAVAFYWAAALAFVFGFAVVCFAEITGPESVPAGRLAVFESDLEGSFNIIPRAEGCWDTAGNKLFFASPESKTYTIIHCGLSKDKVPTPVLSTFEFINGGGVEPVPTPTPSKLTEAEKAGTEKACKSVITGIDAGTIRTPQGARSAFKTLVLQHAGDCTNGDCRLSAAMQEAILAWEKSMDITTLDGLRKGFEAILKEVK